MTRHAVVNARVVTCEDLTVIGDGAVVCDDDRITWVGPTAQLDETLLVNAEIIDARGMSVIPGLVDAHMHISFG
jgi:imidazolonepropionase-like amidohydrolase